MKEITVMKEIDENNVKNIKYENVIAISISEWGAMGEKCGVHIVLENYVSAQIHNMQFRYKRCS